MAVNDTRSMNADFEQGSIDCTYIQLAPNRGAVENPPLERRTWPQFQHAEQWPESPFMEANLRRLANPREMQTSSGSDLRF